MKTVSTNFMTAWRKRGSPSILIVKYKRRYWNGSAYVYEANWHQLTPRDVQRVGQIIWKLDTPLLNVIKVSNCTLYLRNDDYQWLPTNTTTGIYAPDATAPNGYDAFLTQFQILFGYELADGTTEAVALFTGVSLDPIFDTDSVIVEMPVSGNEYLLETANAQLVADTFTSEALSPAPDGTNKVFTTASKGISFIDPRAGIVVGGANKIQGTDYTLAGMNTYQGVVTVTFASAPALGSAPAATGRKWKTLQKIEDLVGLLCDQAGINAASRSISAAIFPGGLSASNIWQTEADWEAGSRGVLVDTTTVPGQFSLSVSSSWGPAFSDAMTGGFANWTENDGGGGSFSSDPVLGAVMTSPTGARSAILQTGPGHGGPCGGWSLQFRIGGVSGSAWNFLQFRISDPNGWYWIYITTDGTNMSIQFQKSAGSVTLLSKTIPWDANFHSLSLTRDNTGLWTLVVDGGTVGTITDTSNLSQGGYFWANLYGYAGQTAPAFRNLVITETNDSDYNILAVFDMSGPTALGTVAASGTIPANTSILIETQTSTSNAPFSDPDGWKAVAVGGSVQSAVRRYIKIRLTLSRTSDALTPIVTQVKLTWTTTVVQLAMADFSSIGPTCFDAVSNLTKLCDYESGFKGDGTFFFRPKAAGSTPVISISNGASGTEKVVTRIAGFTSGFGQVVNDGQVSSGGTSGGYISIYNSSSLPEASPTSIQRFRDVIRSEDWSSFLLAYDVNIADGRARLIHDNNYKPKRQGKLYGKIIPFLDLSDIVSVSFYERMIDQDNVWGDPLRQWGKNTPFGLPTNMLMRNMSAKVVGIAFDPTSGLGEEDVVEVLS